jgi:hypothetical protein
MRQYNQEVREMRSKLIEIKKELVKEDLDSGQEKLIHLSYDRLADGGRYPHQSKKIDSETADAIRRAFC